MNVVLVVLVSVYHSTSAAVCCPCSRCACHACDHVTVIDSAVWL